VSLVLKLAREFKGFGRPGVPENPKAWFLKTRYFTFLLTRFFVPKNPRLVPENPKFVPDNPYLVPENPVKPTWRS
jgi:hypothetical protein